ncbi:hypothetical protein Cgig2_002798 [Carnegiea gigantea]|uniref:Uncharacterized protein n=1 Tax=Carnegiea gigantea TaxID=171969 RepID=A0A9Q1KLG5_9CARY|nr:hypothetical protein Cgig2_002798 [Carnegiea gigantea]
MEDVELGKLLVKKEKLFTKDLAKEGQLTTERFEKVDRVYVICEDDEMLKPDFQQWMIDRSPPSQLHFASPPLCLTLDTLQQSVYLWNPGRNAPGPQLLQLPDFSQSPMCAGLKVHRIVQTRYFTVCTIKLGNGIDIQGDQHVAFRGSIIWFRCENIINSEQPMEDKVNIPSYKHFWIIREQFPLMKLSQGTL